MEQHNHHDHSSRPEDAFLAYCHICKAKLSSRYAEVVQEKDDKQLVHVECQACGSCALMVATPVPHHPFYANVVMLTDMSKKDVKRALNMDPITPDDVLEVHQHFRNYK